MTKTNLARTAFCDGPLVAFLLAVAANKDPGKAQVLINAVTGQVDRSRFSMSG
jgi:hypothetical protein